MKMVSSGEIRVLKAIRSDGPVSRRDLPELTGLAAGTITLITADLLRRGFITEKREATGQSGRPRVFLEIREDGPIVLGATLTENGALRTTFVDLSGNIRFGTEIETGIGVAGSLDDLAEAVGRTLEAAIEASGCDRKDIERIGLSLPALVDSDQGVIHFMMTFPQTPFPFAKVVSARLGLPVTLENHMSCLARAEHWFGQAKGLDSFTLIHIGPAIGSAQYFAGMPRTGVHGIAPQIGHVKTARGDDAARCYCGAHGCATAYASIYGMVQQAGLVDGFDIAPAQQAELFGQLVARASEGDEAMLEVVERGAAHLALLAADIVIATDPGVILVTVPDARCIELMRGRFDEVFRAHLVPGVASLTEVRFAVALPDWEAKGAAALALERVRQ
ncbi:ROK family transcriptional regulator [Novosphingobium sp. JCM 18896]|uniref:ROK family transcriptional regulator n=1 Tax=Novosphingobium sp. JCM 18896 TaxID=2989731 RepID=UPI002223233E|nr:ROK family transcriptional regulator [Novosphingobium sp. JCM 18896]MCW1429541.1 ROK family transcriptional regulator [Novosphingobium sp. JCM 18896]